MLLQLTMTLNGSQRQEVILDHPASSWYTLSSVSPTLFLGYCVHLTEKCCYGCCDLGKVMLFSGIS